MPGHRYSFSKRREKKNSKIAVFILLIVAVLVIGGGIAAFLLIRAERSDQEEVLTESEALYELWEARKYEDVIQLCNSRLEENPLDTQALALAGFSYFYKALGE